VPRTRVIIIRGVQLAWGILLARNLQLEATLVEEFRPFIDKGHVRSALIDGEVSLRRLADVRGGPNHAVDDEDTVADSVWRGVSISMTGG
jgi:hypothetical protein